MVTISLSCEQGLLWRGHEPLQSLTLRLGNLPPSTRSTLLTGDPRVSFRSLKTSLSSLWVCRTGSASDWYALMKRYINAYIQHNTYLNMRWMYVTFMSMISFTYAFINFRNCNTFTPINKVLVGQLKFSQFN